MNDLLQKLRKKLPDVQFKPGEAFSWSPRIRQITFKPGSSQPNDEWSLLHEAAHASLGHKTYSLDIELILLEVEAWETAKELGEELGVAIDETHIQDSLDTYRDWLHQRSTCPTCSSVSLQTSAGEYTCHNCLKTWHVTNARFCRPYRLGSRQNKKPLSVNQATFH